MEFGHTDGAIENIDFSLPADSNRTKQVLEAVEYGGDLQVYIGASKWGEKSWIGQLYPAKAPEKTFLPIYSKSFNTVEFGPTFYNIPGSDQLAKWVNDVAEQPDFKFCPKFPQTITHIRRLSNAEEQTARFYQCLAGFGKHLGPLLLQLGEKFSPKSLPQLKAYLESLPPSLKVSVEVRHPDWFSQASNRNELFQLLQKLNINTVISDTSGRRDCVHMELTTNEAVIRFVGNDLAPSDYIRLDQWVERLYAWKTMGLQRVWFFMHQNNEKFVPQACDYLIKRLNEQLGTSVARPRLLNDQPKLRLF